MRGTAAGGKALSRAELKLLADGLTWLLGGGRRDRRYPGKKMDYAHETRRRPAGSGPSAGASDSQAHKAQLGRRQLRGGAQK
jgi:hypothetical protein